MTDDGLTLDLFADEAETDDSRSAEEEGDAVGAAEEYPATEPASPEVSGESFGEAAGDRGAEPDVWTVSQVNRAVRKLLEGTLPALWVSGEVGGWKRARSGHCYFTLKDDQAQLRCVMWRTEASRLPTDPDEGMEVRVHGSLTLYEARGEYQLVVRKVEAAGAEGLWRLAFEKLRKKLEIEGLLAPERKRRLPRFPGTVAVVTSPTGAAIRDVLTVIRRRAPWTRVIVRGCRVQGEGASLEVAEAIQCVGRSGLADVVIVGRGGGSLEDLWAFNEEPVARAIARSPVPVISAVGHEVDVTIADLVADHRAATPSAAAEAAVQDGAALLDGLRALPPRLVRALRSCCQRRRDRVEGGGERLGRAIERLLTSRRDRAVRSLDRIDRGMERLLTDRRQALRHAAGKIQALSPLSTLQRGYAVPLGDGGRVLRSVADFPEGAAFTLRVADGRVRASAIESLREPSPDFGAWHAGAPGPSPLSDSDSSDPSGTTQ